METYRKYTQCLSEPEIDKVISSQKITIYGRIFNSKEELKSKHWIKGAIGCLIKSGQPISIDPTIKSSNLPKQSLIELKEFFLNIGKEVIIIQCDLGCFYPQAYCNLCGRITDVIGSYEIHTIDHKNSVESLCGKCIDNIIKFSNKQVMELGKNGMKTLFLLRQMFNLDLTRLIFKYILNIDENVKKTNS